MTDSFGDTLPHASYKVPDAVRSTVTLLGQRVLAERSSSDITGLLTFRQQKKRLSHKISEIFINLQTSISSSSELQLFQKASEVLFTAESHWWIVSGTVRVRVRALCRHGNVPSHDATAYQKMDRVLDGKSRGGGLVTEYFQTTNEDGCEDSVSSLTL